MSLSMSERLETAQEGLFQRTQEHEPQNLVLDIIGYIIGFCPAAVAVKFLCCCKHISATFVLNHITHFQVKDHSAPLAPPAHQRKIDPLEQHLCKHLDELIRVDSLCTSEFFSLTWARREVFSTLGPRVASFRSEVPKSNLIPRFNGSILKRLYLQGRLMESVIAAISASPLPNLEVLHVSTDFNNDYSMESKDIHKIDRHTLLDVIARNTGALTYFQLKLSYRHYGEKITRSLLRDLRAIALSNPQLAVMNIHLVHFDSHAFLSLLRKLSSSIQITAETWTSLPAYVQSSLGIPISCLRLSGHTVWQYCFDDFFSDEHLCSILQTLWTAVYPKSPEHPWSVSLAEIMAFNVPYISPRLREGGTAWQQNAAEWILRKAAQVFDSISPQVAPFEDYARALFGVITFASRFKVDSRAFVERAFELASTHYPDAHPFASLVIFCSADETLHFDPSDEDLPHKLIVHHMLDLALTQHTPLKLFEAVPPTGTYLAFILLRFFPDSLLTILENDIAFDADECVRRVSEKSMPRIQVLLDHVATEPYKFLYFVDWRSRIKAINRIFTLVHIHFPESDWITWALVNLFSQWSRTNLDLPPPVELESILALSDFFDARLIPYIFEAFPEDADAAVERLMTQAWIQERGGEPGDAIREYLKSAKRFSRREIPNEAEF